MRGSGSLMGRSVCVYVCVSIPKDLPERVDNLNYKYAIIISLNCLSQTFRIPEG